MDFPSFLDTVATLSLKDVASYDHFCTSGGDRWAGPHVILIGCGNWKSVEGRIDAPLLLQNKGAAQRFGKGYSSVTKMLMDPLDSYLENWAGWPPASVDLQEFVNRLRLVGEDGNPDSIFGFLVFLARVSRVSTQEFPTEWIEAIDEWERSGTADRPFQSWCSLESALAHSLMPAVKLNESSMYTDIWQQGLRFAVSALKERYSPTLLPVSPSTPYHAKAYSALEQDEQAYQDWLQHAHILQLSLPVTDLPGRHRLVDMLIIEERQLTGAAKNFYRNDVVNSPLGAGFTCSVVYRPNSSESKPDITISVDPRRRVSLRKLREELEVAETAAWRVAQEVRPSDKIRPLEGVTSEFNEPWFINSDGTLIGSPRKIAGKFAGRLSWQEVKDLILRECNPLRDIQVLPEGASQSVPILAIGCGLRRGVAPNSYAEEKTVVIASWPRGSDETGILIPASLPRAPIVRQLLAALTDPRRTQGEIGMTHLAAESTFDQVKLTGGFAIVSDGGVFVLDDWTKESLDHDALRRTFEAGALLHNRLATDLEPKQTEITDELRKLLDASSRPANLDALVKQLAVLSLDVAQLRSSTSAPPADWNARLLKEAMNDRWSLERRLSGLETQIKAMDASLRNLIETKRASINRFIAVYGFALAVASGLSAPVAKALYEHLNNRHPQGDPPGVWVIVTFAVLALLFSALLRFWVGRTDLLRRL